CSWIGQSIHSISREEAGEGDRPGQVEGGRQQHLRGRRPQDQREQAPLQEEQRWTPYGNTKCIICKQQVHQDGKYCHTCAYSKGVCAMCGKQVLDTKLYKQSNV
uniref:Cysteine-rich PDZ-binding protein n=1 Tax=Aegilops tauschii subsp. strangulata TaxID=200361 RepID=A0A453QWN2_AEGTS